MMLPWDRHKNLAGLNRLMGSQPSPLDNWISNSNIWTNDKQTWTDSASNCCIMKYQEQHFHNKMSKLLLIYHCLPQKTKISHKIYQNVSEQNNTSFYSNTTTEKQIVTLLIFILFNIKLNLAQYKWESIIPLSPTTGKPWDHEMKLTLNHFKNKFHRSTENINGHFLAVEL